MQVLRAQAALPGLAGGSRPLPSFHGPAMQPGGQSLYASTLSQLAQSAQRLAPVPDGVEYQVQLPNAWHGPGVRIVSVSRCGLTG